MKEINPKNRTKKKFKFLLRFVEDQIKNFFLSIVIFISIFFNVRKRGKKILNLGNYVDIYSINYLVFSLSPKYTFICNFTGSISLIRRLGLRNFFKNCKLNFLSGKNTIRVFYNKKDKIDEESVNFDFDYFKYFDEEKFYQLSKEKYIMLPYYLRAEFYKKNLFKKYEQFRNKKKIFKIIFSGSNHLDWYEQLKWQRSVNDKESILSRCEILNFVKEEFKDEVQIIRERSEINSIDRKKKILFFVSDPSKKRKFSKILSMDEHIEFIASSNFFLTCPGTAMPICHHIVESMFVGTVPITLYGNLLFPKLNSNNSLMFDNYSDLYESIKRALTINDEDFIQMKKEVLSYYDKHLSPSSFLNNFQSQKLPVTLYMNVDGHTLDARRERFGLPRLFPLPKN